MLVWPGYALTKPVVMLRFGHWARPDSPCIPSCHRPRRLSGAARHSPVTHLAAGPKPLSGSHPQRPFWAAHRDVPASCQDVRHDRSGQPSRQNISPNRHDRFRAAIGSPPAGATRPSPGRRQGLTVHRVSGSPCYPTLRHSLSSRRIFGILNFGHYGNPASPLFLKDGNSKGCPSTMGWYVVHMTLLHRAAPMDVTRRHQPHRDVAVRERPAHGSVRLQPTDLS